MANAYETAVLDSLEFESTYGNDASICKIDDMHFAVAYRGANNDGFIKTFSVDGSYNITEIDSLEHDTSNGYGNSLILLDATHLMLSYHSGSYSSRIVVFTLDGSYNISETSTLVHYTSYSTRSKIVKIDTNVIAFTTRDTDNEGRVKIFTYDGSYNVTQEDEVDSGVSIGGDLSICKIDETHFMTTWEISSSLAPYCTIWSVDGSYNITEESNYEIPEGYGSGSECELMDENHVALIHRKSLYGTYFSIVKFNVATYVLELEKQITLDSNSVGLQSFEKLDDTHFAVFYSDSDNDGIVSVVNVQSSAHYQLTVKSVIEIEPSYCVDPVIISLDDNTFASVYSGNISQTNLNAVTISVDIPINIDNQDWTVVNDSIDLFQIGGGVKVFIGGLSDSDNKTSSIIPTSLQIRNVLTRQIDSAQFTLQKYGSSHEFTPVVGQEVFVYVEGVREFGGIITRVTQRAEDYKVILYDVVCEDYTRLLDRKLITDVYENKTIDYILSSLRSRYFDEFTLIHVDGGDTEISYASFNYENASQALTKICDKINYDWYVDYYKNIYFISKTSLTAPFSLSDGDDSYIFDSFRIRTDNTQIRNRVFIAGGEYLADTFTTEYVSDGVQNIYPLAYKYDEIQVSVTGIVWDGGIDGNDAQSTKDYLWNGIEKFIRFRGDRIPNNGSGFSISGQPYLPVRVSVQDDTSINSLKDLEGGDGVYEYIIVDDSINSQDGARERGSAELEAYKNSLAEGSFKTKKQGLRSGQQITVNSDAHGISETYLINSVRFSMKNNIEARWDVSMVSTKTIGVIEILQKLLQDGRNFSLGDQEIVDNVYAVSESVSVAETVTAQSLNYPVEFVAGGLTAPSGYKRIFVLDGSPLGRHISPQFNDTMTVSESITVSLS